MKTYRIEADSPGELLEECKRTCRKAGYYVAKNERPRETPKQFYTRLGVSHAHFNRRINDPDCPAFESKRGPEGKKTVWLVSNPALEAFMEPRILERSRR